MAKRDSSGRFVSTGPKTPKASGAGAGVEINMRKLQRDTRRIQKALRQLGRESRQRKVVSRALGPATTPMNATAKALAPVGQTGAYAKSIGKKGPVTYRQSGNVLIVIGPRDGHSVDSPYGPGKHNPAKIGHLLEFGHGGPRPSPPKPHLRPAFEIHRNSAQRIFQSKFWPLFRKEIARVRAKGG